MNYLALGPLCAAGVSTSFVELKQQLEVMLMAYCDKTMYVIEALYANPHKYGESEKQTLREHMVECEICLEAAHNTEQASKGMYHNFDL